MGLFNLILFAIDAQAEIFEHTLMSAYSWYYLEEAHQSVLLVILALCSLGFGFSIGNRKWRQEKIKKEIPRRFFIGGLVGTLFFGTLVFISGELGHHPYSEFFELMSNSDSRIFIQSLGLLCPMLLLTFASCRSGKHYRLALLFFIVFILPMFFAGWRGMPVITVLCMIPTLAQSNRSLMRRYLPIIGVGAAILISSSYFIGQTRSGGQAKAKGFWEPLVHTIGSVSQQLNTVVFTLHEVNDGHPLIYGQSYLEAFKAVPPNLSLQWVPDHEREVSEFSGLGGWVTSRVVHPYVNDSYGGISYSGVAEAFLNFGRVGVVLVFTGMGVFLIWLERASRARALSSALYGLIFYCCYFGSIKGELILITRNFTIVMIYCWFIYKIIPVFVINRSSSNIDSGHVSNPASSWNTRK